MRATVGILLSAAVLALSLAAAQRPAPNPVLAERLMDERMDVYGLVHWGLNTYTDREWGYGDEDPKMFDPKKFDADKIAAAAKAGGLGGIILVAKHHDGFCLWPTKTTDHNIAKSPFRGGKGDVVKEFEQACRKAGLRFGVYVSPWDRHDAKYGTADYVERYHRQIRELLGGDYGEIFEMWFDGANGGDGWYGGAKEKRIIPKDYYRFDEIFRFVRELQPKVCIFNERDDADFRWPGNEEGLLEPDCRATVPHFDPANYAPYMAWCADGTHEGVSFHPPEADFPLRRGWFYHPAQDGNSKSGEYLMKSYLRTVGNGGTMNLGLAPNKDGELTDEDIGALRRFGEIRKAFFAKEAKEGEPFNVVVMREDVSHGERIDAWSFAAEGRTLLEGKSIGTKRIRVLEEPAVFRNSALNVRICDRGEPFVDYRLYYVDSVLLRKVLRSTCAGGETDTAKWMQGFRGLTARPQPMPAGAKACATLKADVDGKPLACWTDGKTSEPTVAFAFSLRAAVTVTFPEKVSEVKVEPEAKKLRFYKGDDWVSVIVNEPGEYAVSVNGGKSRLRVIAKAMVAGQTAAGPAPLLAAMELAKPGAVKPLGRLLAAAQAQRDGCTGRLDEIDDQFRRAWAPETHPRGKDLSWNTKPGAWSCEGGAYWFDGLVKLAFQLDDPGLKTMASNRLETVLSRMPERPIGFCWWLDRDDPQCVKEMNGDPWLLWVAGMFERPVAAWYEATGDRRVPEILARVFDGHAFAYRGRATTPSGAVDAYRLTHDRRIAAANDAYFAELAEHPEMLRPVERQYLTPPVRYLEETLSLLRRHQNALGIPSRHGVIASETLLSIFRAYQWTGRAKWLKAVRAWYAFFDTYMRQPYGFTAMDEEWGFPGPGRGTETCVVAAEAWTRINLLAGLGEGTWGDDVECGFYNAGANCVTPDFRKHVYIQLPNRIAANDLSQCSFGGDPGEFLGRYEAKHWPLCCTAAQNRILPNFVQAMWMLASDGGVAATLYGPCSFETELKGGRFAVVEETDYPSEDTIRIRIVAAPAGGTAVRFRMPKWCANPSLELNGKAVAPSVTNDFAVLSRMWTAGDVVTLRFPMKTELHIMRDHNPGQYGRRYGYFMRGPVLLAKKVPGTDENTPVEPVVVPEITKETDPTTLGLVPYGEAKLRISMFPIREK